MKFFGRILCFSFLLTMSPAAFAAIRIFGDRNMNAFLSHPVDSRASVSSHEFDGATLDEAMAGFRATWAAFCRSRRRKQRLVAKLHAEGEMVLQQDGEGEFYDPFADSYSSKRVDPESFTGDRVIDRRDHADLSSNFNRPRSLYPLPDASTRSEDRQLFDAISNGNEDMVRWLLSSGSADINAVVQEGNGLYSMLCRALSRSNDEIVCMLLDKGADVDALRYSGYAYCPLAFFVLLHSRTVNRSEEGIVALLRRLLDRTQLEADQKWDAVLWRSALGNGFVRVLELLSNHEKTGLTRHYILKYPGLYFSNGLPFNRATVWFVQKMAEWEFDFNCFYDWGATSPGLLLERVIQSCGADELDDTAANSALEVVRTLIRCGADARLLTSKGATLLLAFVKVLVGIDNESIVDRLLPIADLLIESGARTNATDLQGQTVFDVIRGNAKLEHHFLRYSASNEDINWAQRKQLCDAVKAGDVTVVQRLVENEDADPNTVDSEKRLPLYIALETNNIPMAELLVDLGAVLVERDGKSLLEHAVMGGNAPFVSFLLGKSDRLQRGDQFTESTKARAYYEALKKGFLDVVQAFLEYDDVYHHQLAVQRYPNELIPSALRVALANKHWSIVQELLRGGAAPTFFVRSDGKIYTALSDVGGDKDRLNELLARGVFPGSLKEHANVAVYLLVDPVRSAPFERAKFLKERVFKELPLGVSKLILHYSQEPWGALWYTRQMDSLYRVQGSADAFLRAAVSGDEEQAMRLVRRRWADTDLTMDRDDNSALMLAAANGHVSLVKRLLTKQWPSFIEENIEGRFHQVNKQGNTALMLAAANGHLEVVRYLLDNNNAGCGRIDMANGSGKTALVMAKENGHEDVCQFLTSRAVSQVVRSLCSRVEELAREDAVSQVVEDLCSRVEESVRRDFASRRNRFRSIEEERPSK